MTVMIGGEPYTLGLFDTAGKRPFNHVSADVPKDVVSVVLVTVLYEAT